MFLMVTNGDSWQMKEKSCLILVNGGSYIPEECFFDSSPASPRREVHLSTDSLASVPIFNRNSLDLSGN